MSSRMDGLLMIVFCGVLVYAGWRPLPRLPFRPPWWVPPKSWEGPMRVLGVLFGGAGVLVGIGLLLGWLPAD
jgi:hypothetical protein